MLPSPELATDHQHDDPRPDVMFPEHCLDLGAMCSALADDTALCLPRVQETHPPLLDVLRKTGQLLVIIGHYRLAIHH